MVNPPDSAAHMKSPVLVGPSCVDGYSTGMDNNQVPTLYQA